MEREREVACTIIDLVENAIRQKHRLVEKYASKRRGNTLLYGEIYYDLEDEIVEYLKKQLRIPKDFNPSKRGEHICDNCKVKQESDNAMYDA